MNKALTNLNDGQKKPPHHVGEDRDGEEIHPVTQWNKRIYSNLRLHFDYTSTKKSPVHYGAAHRITSIHTLFEVASMPLTDQQHQMSHSRDFHCKA